MKAAVLFAGIGGWEIAAAQHGIATVWACEWDAWKAARYRERFPATELYGDVAAIDGWDMVKRHGAVDVLLGSPPCTDISSANAAGRGIDGDDSRYYFEAIRLAGEMRPRWCAFENSDRLRTRGADRVLAALDALGYACWPLVVAAGHAGAPHIRRRSWVIAADAVSLGLRDESGRCGWAGRQAHGAVEGGGGCGRDAADAGVRIKRRGRALGRRQWRSQETETPRPVWPEAARDANGAGLAIGQGFAGNHGAQFPAAQRAIVHPWDHAGDGLACHLRMADGVPAGVARKWRSAYGDAVVIPVVSAILAGLIATDKALCGRAVS